MDRAFILHDAKQTFSKLKNLQLVSIIIFLMLVLRWIEYDKYFLFSNVIFVMLVFTSVILNINNQHIYSNSYFSLSRFNTKFHYESVKTKSVILNTLIFLVIVVTSIEINDFVYSQVHNEIYRFDYLLTLKYLIRVMLYLILIQSFMIIVKNYFIRESSDGVYIFTTIVLSIILTQFNDFIFFVSKESKFYLDFYVSPAYLEADSLANTLLLNVHFIIIILILITINYIFSREIYYDFKK